MTNAVNIGKGLECLWVVRDRLWPLSVAWARRPFEAGRSAILGLDSGDHGGATTRLLTLGAQVSPNVHCCSHRQGRPERRPGDALSRPAGVGAAFRLPP